MNFSLQAACSEVMAIRAARCYDLSTQTIVLASGTPCTLENMIAAGGSVEYWKLVFQFCHGLAENQTDNTEYALFTAICIFSGKYTVSVNCVGRQGLNILLFVTVLHVMYMSKFYI